MLLWRDISIGFAAILFAVYVVVSGAIQLIIGVTVGKNTAAQALLFIGGATSLVLGGPRVPPSFPAVLLLGSGWAWPSSFSA